MYHSRSPLPGCPHSTNPRTHVKNTCTSTFVHREANPSSGVNEVLEFLKAAQSQQTALFHSPPTPLPHVNFAGGPVFLVATLHLTLHTDSRVSPPWRCTEVHKRQRDGVHLKDISAGFIIADQRKHTSSCVASIEV